MAVAAEVLLLVLISNNIHAQVLQSRGRDHHFTLNTSADVCSVSRWVGEERKLVWNSSRSSEEREDFYEMFNLKASDSGQYQVQCWTQGNLTHDSNSSILVCDDQKMRRQSLYLDVGQTAEVTCDGAGPNQSVQWAIDYFNSKTYNDELALIDDETSSWHKLQLVKNKSSLLVTMDKPHRGMYYCLQKNQQGCDTLSSVSVDVRLVYILHWVGQSLELNCSDVNQPHEWSIYNSVKDHETRIYNHTLMFPSLTLNHSGVYVCETGDLYYERYQLYVCPESDVSAVVFFTGGENVTLQCGNWTWPHVIERFMRMNRTEGRLTLAEHYEQDNMYRSDTSLVITNVSLGDGGEFWCVVMKHRHCVFTSKTLVMFREPEVDHHLVRSMPLSVVIMMMCVVVVVTVVWSTRSREQLPAPVEELEMSELSPESADPQEESSV